MSYPSTQLKTVTVPGGSLSAAEYNAEMQNIYNNVGKPENVDDYSETVAEMKLQVDPGEVGTESQAISLSGEIERLRFAIKDVKNFIDPAVSFWYETPTTFSPSILTSLTVTSIANIDVATISANFGAYTGTILTLESLEEDTGSYTFIKCTSDTDGVPVDQFVVDEGGNVACGSITGTTITLTSGDINANQFVPIGTIVSHYDFDAAISVNTTYWKICDGTTETVAGIGSQTMPDLSNRYLVGFGAEEGGDNGSASWVTAAIGNATHTLNLQHSHTVDAHSHTTSDHNHALGNHSHSMPTSTGIIANGGSNPTSSPYFVYDGGSWGNSDRLSTTGGNNTGQHRHDFGGSTGTTDLGITGSANPSTNNTSPETNSQLSNSVDIRPRSIRVRYYMRIL